MTISETLILLGQFSWIIASNSAWRERTIFRARSSNKGIEVLIQKRLSNSFKPNQISSFILQSLDTLNTQTFADFFYLGCEPDRLNHDILFAWLVFSRSIWLIVKR
ncbi:hypothetical protein CPB83DRAFT_858960 [Crepidotus variabilis]|uniref:Uncharacterized protein n=1 Tax=Crepidotus variabilis TaxID=179855 RepID=A0A9P6EAX3_9AGAR|nr:hypothetical protein CPB83DRAFT_858960 [Crepidotus variabilis]